jgi:hypothetical protein
MAAPADLRKSMSWKDYTSFLEKELEILSRPLQKTGGSLVTKKPWEYLPGFWRDAPRTPDYMYHVAWDINPLPLSSKEERDIIRRRRWRNVEGLQFGEYKVSPSRYDLQWIQRIYWTSREIRGITRLILRFPQYCYSSILKEVLSDIHSLSPGNGQTSSLQRKLRSDVYYCLRQCNRLKDDE